MQVYHLTNRSGCRVSFMALGGIVTAVEMPDRQGRIANVVLGYKNLEAYRSQRIYLGCITGRYANRIANARFTLDGTEYVLAATDGTSSVHGGRRGFDKANWTVVQDDSATARLSYVSPDGDEGFPGKLAVTVRYRLTDENAFEISYEARTDRPTIVNLTNHSYFNLAGEGTGDILDHQLQIVAANYTPADALLIPTGEIAPVEGTPFDFRTSRRIGDRIRVPHPQMIAGKGYDLNYVIDRNALGLVHAATLIDSASGRSMAVETTEPGLQLYTGNLLDSTVEGPAGALYRQSDGVCLETHHYPNSPNTPQFPSTVLRPSELYSTRTTYRFGVEN